MSENTPACPTESTSTCCAGSPADSPTPTPAPLRGGVLDPAAIDPNVRAADDLFRYVNGTWLTTAPIPADRASAGAFYDLRDSAEAACRDIVDDVAASQPDVDTPAGKIAALYSSFMDEEHLDALGATPLDPELTPLRRASSKDDLARQLGSAVATGFTGFIGVDVENDLNDPEHYTTWIGQAGIALPDESYYRDDAHADLREAYVSHIAAMLTHAGLADDDAHAQDSAQRVMAVETAFARGHWDRVTCRDIDKMNNPRTWDDVTASAPGFPWTAWHEGVTEAARRAGVELGDFLVRTIVTQPDYLPHAAEVWQSTTLEDLQLWAAWHVIHSRATLLSSVFVEENFAFYSKRLQGIDQLRPRWKRGVGLVESCLGEALGELYVARHFPPAHKEAMEGLVADLIEAYRQSITSLEWMGADTRERALDKLAQFTPKIGYPTTWRDYSAVVITPGNVLASVRSVEDADFARALRKLTGPVDREEWHMTPQTVNAYYNPTMNEIVFPAAILQPPFFDPQVDDAINYAGIGAVIGHEIGHGFDDQGSTFDGTGKVTDWWTQADRDAFTARTHALIAQYDAYQPAALVAKAEREGNDPAEVPHVNGALTIGENIGDLGGLGIALKAYRLALSRQGIESFADAPVIDGLSALERFFYSWARIWRGKHRDEHAELLLTIDPHSPSEFRCNGIVRNVDAFYEAFGLTDSDALWLAPEERVSIW